MKINFKPGGGNKPQPYIPAGNGCESGEYTTKLCFNKKIINKMLSMDCFLLDKDGKFNLKKSRLVSKVEMLFLLKKGKLYQILVFLILLLKKQLMVLLFLKDIIMKEAMHI